MNCRWKWNKEAHESWSIIIIGKQGQTNLLFKWMIGNQTRLPLIIYKGWKI
jgi:hypothetical protein